MSDLRLRELAERAEPLVVVPDLATLERRGRDLRTRRRVGVLAAVAVVLALLGTLVVQIRTPRAVEPVRPLPDLGGAQPYPGPEMVDLAAGTYRLVPSSVSTDPYALVTVPPGWNSWQGPNRFDGHRPGDPTEGPYNEPALSRATWYAGLLVLKIAGVSRHPCTRPSGPGDFVETYAQAVDAVRHLPGYRHVVPPETTVRFGYPSTRFDLRMRAGTEKCLDEYNLFATSADGVIGGEERMELWLVDIDAIPFMVYTGTDGQVPPRIAAELDAMVDSIEFVDPG